MVKLHFADNGIGIDLTHNADKIFGLYRRFHTHTEGKGMGLYMVKNQVEQLGGTITVTSAVNQGTQFTILLPNS
jgi:signal transduction histidine kinase